MSNDEISETECLHVATNKALIIAMRSLIKATGVNKKELEKIMMIDYQNMNHHDWPKLVQMYTAQLLDTFLEDETSKVRSKDHLKIISSRKDDADDC